jgi:dTDP-4-dehydrorhamnose reductase
VIVVLGSNGQLGQELSREARTANIPLHGLTKDTLDIADEVAVDRTIGALAPSLIVNAAAYTKVDAAEDNWAAAYRTNVDGAAAIAYACAARNIPLIHISTDYVFDGTKSGAYTETDPTTPINAYGRSKAAGEAAVRQISPQHIILRTAWLYGEFGTNFLKTILRLSQEREELRIVADQFGCPTSTGDLARAILAIAPSAIGGTAPWGTYHFVGDGQTTWHGFAQHIVATQAAVTHKSPKVAPIATHEFPTRATRPANSVLDSSLFVSAFGIKPAPWKQESETVTTALLPK